MRWVLVVDKVQDADVQTDRIESNRRWVGWQTKVSTRSVVTWLCPHFVPRQRRVCCRAETLIGSSNEGLDFQQG